MRLDKVARDQKGAEPIEKLLRRGAFKCYRMQYGCSGSPAASVDVYAMDVGMSKRVAFWSAEPALGGYPAEGEVAGIGARQAAG